MCLLYDTSTYLKPGTILERPENLEKAMHFSLDDILKFASLDWENYTQKNQLLGVINN